MSRWGPSEDCKKCGQPKEYGHPCPHGCDDENEDYYFLREMQDEEDFKRNNYGMQKIQS